MGTAVYQTTPALTVEEAERVTEQIADRIDAITMNVEVVMSLMRDALARNAHDVLGYVSPGAYIADRFGSALSGLSASLRREFVHELSEAGMSTRAIAPVFDVSQKTIVKDRQVIPPVSPTPAPRPEPEEVEADPITGEVIEDAEIVEDVPRAPAPRPVIGLDGKEYKRPEPRPVPVPTAGDADRQNAEEASKALARSLQNLTSMRFEGHRTRMITHWWPLGNDAVPPDWKALFEPKAIREIASWLTQLADEMETSK